MSRLNLQACTQGRRVEIQRAFSAHLSGICFSASSSPIHFFKTLGTGLLVFSDARAFVTLNSPHGAAETLVLLRIIVLERNLKLNRLAEFALLLLRAFEHLANAVVELIARNLASTAHFCDSYPKLINIGYNQNEHFARSQAQKQAKNAKPKQANCERATIWRSLTFAMKVGC